MFEQNKNLTVFELYVLEFFREVLKMESSFIYLL